MLAIILAYINIIIIENFTREELLPFLLEKTRSVYFYECYALLFM